MSASTWYVITAKCYTWVDIFPRYSLSASIFIVRLCLKKVSTISYSLNSLFLRIRKNIHSIALHCPPMILSTAVYFQSCHSCGTATPATPATAPHSGPCHSRWDEKPRQPGAGDQSSQRNFAEVSQYSERATTFALTLMNLTKFYLWKSVPISGDLTMFKTPV